MGQLANKVYSPVSSKTQTAAIGQATGYVAATAADYVPLNGAGTVVRIKTTGTPTVATLDSVTPSNFGGDSDNTVTIGATAEFEFFLKNDKRYDQGGANAGYAKITYSSITGVSIDATVVPA